MKQDITTLAKYFTILTAFVLGGLSSAVSQTLNTQQLISEFKKDGLSQTDMFGAVGRDLVSNFNEARYKDRVKEIQDYLRTNKDTRITVRLFMYERMAYGPMNKPDTMNNPTHVLRIIKMAGTLGDEQLLSELYSKYSGVCPPSEKLYYLLKCLEIQDRIGPKYFSNINSNYYWASELLYINANYKSSARYAARSAVLYSEKDKHDLIFQYILAVDIAGASYLKINQPDSAAKYFKIIDNLLDDRATHPNQYASSMTPEVIQIWRGIVKGGIGEAYALRNEYDKAYPLLLENLQSSIKFAQWGDAAEVQTSLAQIDEERKNARVALSRYVNAYQLALRESKLAVLAKAAKGASTGFASFHQYDSAYVYYQNYLQAKNTIDKNINQSRLDSIQSQLNFEDMQKDLLKLENNLVNQKHILSSIILATVFLLITGSLLYNRKKLHLSLQKERLEKETQRSESKIFHAQQQIDHFTKNIAEKNSLIEELQRKLIGSNPEISPALNNFIILTDNDWRVFKDNFKIIYPSYIERLTQKMPQITQGEQRIILLAKLGLSNKEMAQATGVSSETIRSVVSRMRKKFNIDSDIWTSAEGI